MKNPRAGAAQVLGAILQHKGSLASLLPSAQADCIEKDRPLLAQLCYGTARNFPRLHLIAQHLLDRPLGKKDQDIYALLLTGLYQLTDTRVPPHAAIAESVNVVRTLKKQRYTGLINATLRRFEREGEIIRQTLASEPAYQYNHPEWMINKLSHNWPTHWQDILTQNNGQGPMTIRVNQRYVSRETYQAQLQEVGITSHSTTFSPDGLVLEHAVDITQLPGFSDGACSVQDEAAQLGCGLLKPQSGEYILDACSAPGGKLCHLLEAADITADALELSPKRIARIQENLSRLQFEARILTGDVTSLDWWDGQLYDKIFLDAPCSATGVIRRNPDIKMLRNNEEVHHLAQLQYQALSNLWTCLKPGGQLLYATCSVFPQENAGLVKRFIQHTQNAEELPIAAQWGEPQSPGRQLFPATQGHDGFYYALLYKQERDAT